MQKFIQKQRGAISIFLVIILLPMLLLSSIMVDASRVQLAKAVAAAGGDLTLNTALAQYDTVLNDMYGLFAMSQSREDLLDNLEGYYTRCVTSAGIEEADATLLVASIMNEISSIETENDSVNFLNMDILDFTAKTPTGGNLANPALLKAQIVEFMKYRAPINAGLGIIEMIKSFGTLDKEMKVIEDKTNYYKEEEKVYDDCLEAYKAIQSYKNMDTDTIFEEIKVHCSSYQDKIKRITDNILYLMWKNEVKEMDSIDTYELGTPLDYLPSEDELEEAIENVKDKKDEYEDAKTEYSIYYNIVKSTDHKVNLEKIVQYHNKKNDLEYDPISCYNEYALNYNILLAYEMDLIHYETEDGDEITEKERLENKYLEKISSIKSGNEDLDEEIQDFHKYMTEIYKDVKNHLDSIEASTNNDIKEVKETIEKDIQNLEKAKGYLVDAGTALDHVYERVKQGGDLEKTRNEWKSSSEDEKINTTTIATTNQVEVKSAEDKFDENDVQKLLDRVRERKEIYDDAQNKLNEYSYFDIPLSELNQEVLSQRMRDCEEVKAKTEGNISGLEDILAQKYYKQGGTITAANIDISRPNILRFEVYLHKNFRGVAVSNTSSGDVKENGKEKAGNLEKSLTEEKDGKIREADAKIEEALEEAKNVSEISEKENLPSKEWEEVISNIESLQLEGQDAIEGNRKDGLDTSAVSGSSSKIKNFFSGILEMVENMGAGIRDNYYMAEYIMGMFSYDTYEREIILKGRGIRSITEAVALLEEIKGDSEKQKKIVGEKTLTLTKEKVSSENNEAYLREVEYILYGGKNSENLTKAYASIYGIRFACNTVYAFTDAEITSFASTMAVAMFGYPPLTFLVPIAKVAIVIGFSLAESALDLTKLKLGLEVAVFKNKNTWEMSPTGIAKRVKEELKGAVKVLVNKAASELNRKVNELFDTLSEDISTLTEEQTNKLKDIIDESMKEKLEEPIIEIVNQVVLVCRSINANFVLSQEELDQIVDPAAIDILYQGLPQMEIRIDEVIRELDVWASGFTGTDSMILQVKDMAIDYIKEKRYEIIKPFFDIIDNEFNVAEEGIIDLSNQVLEGIENVKTQIMNSIDKTKEIFVKYADDALDKAQEAVKQGIDSFKDYVNGFVGGAIDKLGEGNSVTELTNQNASVLGKLLDFAYSDYLELFLMVALSFESSETSILLRTADAIQLNINKQKGSSGYMMSKAAVFVQIGAEMEVTPLLLNLDLFKDILPVGSDLSTWTRFKYNAIAGY